MVTAMVTTGAAAGAVITMDGIAAGDIITAGGTVATTEIKLVEAVRVGGLCPADAAEHLAQTARRSGEMSCE